MVGGDWSRGCEDHHEPSKGNNDQGKRLKKERKEQEKKRKSDHLEVMSPITWQCWFSSLEALSFSSRVRLLAGLPTWSHGQTWSCR